MSWPPFPVFTLRAAVTQVIRVVCKSRVTKFKHRQKYTNLRLCGLKMHSDKSHQALCASSGAFRKNAKMIFEAQPSGAQNDATSLKMMRLRNLLCASRYKRSDATFRAMMRLLHVTRRRQPVKRHPQENLSFFERLYMASQQQGFRG